MSRHVSQGKWLLLAVAGLFLTAATVCSADTIVLGAAVSQTGKYAREGKFYVDAYQMVVDAINKAGGVKVGGKAYKLELKMYDDQSDPNLGVRLYTRLVTSDKVNFLLGPYSSGITIPASSVSEKYEIPMIQEAGLRSSSSAGGTSTSLGLSPTRNSISNQPWRLRSN